MDANASILQVIAQFEPVPLKGHERSFESNEYRKYWRDEKLAI